MQNEVHFVEVEVGFLTKGVDVNTYGVLLNRLSIMGIMNVSQAFHLPVEQKALKYPGITLAQSRNAGSEQTTIET
jgi:hypothetical protein